ncbi:hypothetical protein [Pseudarthrobacter cellobiosi]|uniref:hypothetical protein n=1 Tax=Pseudarthrobacter cellobiosi TaxID=2953654 RepID=UPI00208F9A22|nr:hypothetical protein [Pseudarthrobacter sp. HLT1-5]MCO4257369.1 hypothetical protein [Pseudarthrobacter sp. HLT1-5]
MSATRLRPPVITEAQILKNRYDEARQIKDAWDWRLRRAQHELRDATVNGTGDRHAAARNAAAVEIQVADAAGELRVALNAWMQATLTHERKTA